MSNRHYYEGLMELIGFIFNMAAHGRNELIRILLVHFNEAKMKPETKKTMNFSGLRLHL